MGVTNVPNGDLPIFIPQESADFFAQGIEDVLGKIWGLLQQIWDYFILGLNAIVGLINIVIETIAVPFETVGYLPQIIGSACLIFFAIGIIKAVR